MNPSQSPTRNNYCTGLCIGVILGISLLVHVLSLVLGSTVFSGWHAANYPVHAAIEMGGTIVALVVAQQLVMLDRRGEGTSFNAPIVGALIGMGILDGLHALFPAGNSFVFLHSFASFFGGLLFALAWLPRRWTANCMLSWLWATPTAVLGIGGLAVAVPDLIPVMIRDGAFTPAAIFLNVAGGLLMFAAAGRLILSYRKTRNVDDVLFCLHCGLFGAAAVMFEQSELWDFAWWGWHVLRLMAYAVALWFMILSNGRTVDGILTSARSQELMRAAFNAANESMLTINAQGRLVDVNQAACLRLGYSRDELLVMNAWELEADGSPATWQKNWRELQRDEYQVFDSTYRTRSDQCFPAEVARALVRFQGERYVCDFVRDVSERRQKEAELQRFKTTLERISDCVFMFDEHTLKFTYANSHALDHLGYSARELFSLTPLDIKPEFPPAKFRALIRPLLNHRRDVVRVETDHRHKDGHLIPVEVYLHHLTDEDGRGRFVATVRDMTERRHYEAALQQARETAEQASVAKSQFLANMSHELRTPLNGVIGMTELLVGTPLTGQQRQFIDACRKSGEALLQLINRILDFSKIEAGKLELDLHTFNLVELVTDTVDTMRWRAVSKGLTTPWYVDKMARYTLKGDSGRLRQVLVNLLNNAITFTDSGSVTLHVRAIDRHDQAVTLRFSVSDTGIGVPADKQARLFESFSQIDSSTSRTYGGTGLGLSISRSLVELMGGTISVRSEQGEGSTFWFDIPFEIASRESELTVQDDAAITPQFAGHVLLAEDNEINRLYVVELLRKLGCECTTAFNGHEVIEALQKQSFDLILMDCQMPLMDGFEATLKVRQLEADGVRAGHIPIIALTANAIKGDRERCLDAGMDDYLSKPVRVDEVRGVLERYLTRLEAATSGEAVAVVEAPAVHAGVEPSADTSVDTFTETCGADSVDASASIDVTALLNRCMGNLEFAESLLDELQSNGAWQVEEIRQFSAQGNAAETANAAHALKGATGILCATTLFQLASNIEQASRTDRLDETEAMIRDLSAEMNRCLDGLPQTRSSMHTVKESSER